VPASAALTATFDRLARRLGDPRARPDLAWVAALAGATEREVAAAIAELAAFAPQLGEIGEALRAGGRTMYAQIRAPFELYALTRLLRPRHIVEVGVSSGISSAHFLLGLRQNGVGELHSIDLPTFQRGPELASGESPVSIPPGRSSGWAVPRTLRTGWELLVGPSQELLPRRVRTLPSIDLFLHDDLHTPAHLAWELRTIRPRLRPGSVVLADNTSWTGRAFAEFADALGARAIAKRGSDLLGLRVPAAADAARR
jgi:predicted O-methyltransferase YrrM